jgi:hypothetical protein
MALQLGVGGILDLLLHGGFVTQVVTGASGSRIAAAADQEGGERDHESSASRHVRKTFGVGGILVRLQGKQGQRQDGSGETGRRAPPSNGSAVFDR